MIRSRPAKALAVVALLATMAWAGALYPSFASILVKPEKFHGKQVTVFGVISLDAGRPAFHMDKDAYCARTEANAIALDLKGEDISFEITGHGRLQPPIDQEKYQGAYATITGTFSATRKGAKGEYAGTLVAIEKVRFRPNMRGQFPPAYCRDGK